MPKYLTEEDVFAPKKPVLGGNSLQSKYVPEEEVFGPETGGQQYIPEHEVFGTPPPRTVTDTAKDTLVSAAKGVLGLGEAGVGLANIVSDGRSGKTLEDTGIDTKAWQQSLSDKYSPAQQAANEEVEQAEGFVGTAKAMFENPSTIYHSVVEALPSMVGGGVAGAGLKVAATKALPGAVAKVEKLGRGTATMLAGAAGEGLVGAGSSAEAIRQETEDGLLTGKQVGLAALSGVGTAVFGAVGGRLAQKLGFADADTMLAGAIGKKATAEAAQAGAPPPPRGVADIGKAIVGGGISEGVFEELPQTVQEQIFQNAALDRPLLEGVPEGAAKGLIVGAAMGSGANIASEVARPLRNARDEQQQPPPATPTPEERKAAMDAIRQKNPTDEDLINIKSSPDLQKQFGITPEDLELFTAERAEKAQVEVDFAGATDAMKAGAQAAIQAEFDRKLWAGTTAKPGEGVKGLTTVNQEDAEAAQFGREALRQNQQRNQPKRQPTPEEIAYGQYEPQLPPDAATRRGDPLMDQWADDAVDLQQREDQKRMKGQPLALPPGQGFEMLDPDEAAFRRAPQQGFEMVSPEESAKRVAAENEAAAQRGQSKVDTFFTGLLQNLDQARQEGREPQNPAERKLLGMDPLSFQTFKEAAAPSKDAARQLASKKLAAIEQANYAGYITDEQAAEFEQEVLAQRKAWGAKPADMGVQIPPSEPVKTGEMSPADLPVYPQNNESLRGVKNIPEGGANSGVSGDRIDTPKMPAPLSLGKFVTGKGKELITISGDTAAHEEAIKSLPGAKWNSTKKAWTVPEESRAEMERVLGGLVKTADVPGAQTVTAPVRAEASPGGVVQGAPAGGESFESMVAEAARWKGAAMKVAKTLTDKKEQLRHSKATTKGDLDAYLQRKFGVDEATARSVSNELTRLNIPADESVDTQDFSGEPWATTSPAQPPAVQPKEQAKPFNPLDILTGKEKPAPTQEERSYADIAVDSLGAAIKQEQQKLEEIRNRKYKKNDKTVSVGGDRDSLNSGSTTVDAANARRKKRMIADAEVRIAKMTAAKEKIAGKRYDDDRALEIMNGLSDDGIFVQATEPPTPLDTKRTMENSRELIAPAARPLEQQYNPEEHRFTTDLNLPNVTAMVDRLKSINRQIEAAEGSTPRINDFGARSARDNKISKLVERRDALSAAITKARKGEFKFHEKPAGPTKKEEAERRRAEKTTDRDAQEAADREALADVIGWIDRNFADAKINDYNKLLLAKRIGGDNKATPVPDWKWKDALDRLGALNADQTINYDAIAAAYADGVATEGVRPLDDTKDTSKAADDQFDTYRATRDRLETMSEEEITSLRKKQSLGDAEIRDGLEVKFTLSRLSDIVYLQLSQAATPEAKYQYLSKLAASHDSIKQAIGNGQFNQKVDLNGARRKGLEFTHYELSPRKGYTVATFTIDLSGKSKFDPASKAAPPANAFSPETAVKLVADDIDRLRPQDVYRLLDSVDGENRETLRKYIVKNHASNQRILDEVRKATQDLNKEEQSPDIQDIADTPGVVSVTDPPKDETVQQENKRLDKLDDARPDITVSPDIEAIAKSTETNEMVAANIIRDGKAFLKKFVKAVPEFNRAPVFVVVKVDERAGDGAGAFASGNLLRFTDSYQFDLSPKLFGLLPENLQPGQKVRLNLDKWLDIKPKGAAEYKQLNILKKMGGNIFNDGGMWSNGYILLKGDSPIPGEVREGVLTRVLNESKAELKNGVNVSADSYRTIVIENDEIPVSVEIGGRMVDRRGLDFVTKNLPKGAAVSFTVTKDGRLIGLNADGATVALVSPLTTSPSDYTGDVERGAWRVPDGVAKGAAITEPLWGEKATQGTKAARPLEEDSDGAIVFTGEEFGPADQPIKSLVEKAKEFARAAFDGKTVINKEDGSSIIIPWQGIKHALSGRVSRNAAIASSKLDEIIRNGSFVREEGDKSGRGTIKRALFYSTAINIGGVDTTVEVVVREHADGRRFYDHYEVKEKPLNGMSGEGRKALSVQPRQGVVEKTSQDVSSGKTIPQPDQESKTNTDDVGEELTANKRNRLKSGLKWDDIKDLDVSLRVKEATKQKVYPRPDYQAMIDAGTPPIMAHIFKQAYDSISAKPTTAKAPTDEDLQRYIDGVHRVMGEMQAWASDGRGAAFLQAMGKRAEKRLNRSLSISGMVENNNVENPYTALYPDGWKPRKEEVYILGGNRFIGGLQPGLDEIVKGMKDIEKGWPGKVESWKKQGYKVEKADKIDVAYYEGKRGKDEEPYVSISYRLDGVELSLEIVDGAESRRDQRVIDAVKAFTEKAQGKFLLLRRSGAMESAHATEQEAVAAAEARVRKEKDNVKEEGYSVEAAIREGEARRLEGEDISSDRLQETFGFKGINFGNWLKGDRNTKERQMHLNHAYDSFMDLAEIMGVPPKAISLDGLLGIAIGAQGSGKAAAHFVPGVNEINLTRTGGAGAVAHEWAHGLDHYFARQAGMARRSDPFFTEYSSLWKQGDGEIRPEIVGHFNAIVKAMEKRGRTEEETKLLMESRANGQKRNLDSWVKHIRKEMVAATPEGANVNVGGKSVSVRERINTLLDQIEKGDFGDGKVAIGPKPTRKHQFQTYLSTPVAELRDLFKTANKRTYNIDSLKALQASIDAMQYSKEHKNEVSTHVPQVSTDYRGKSLEADKVKGGKPYWSTNLEMFARAFAGYVSDQLNSRRIKNTYLVRGESSDAAESKAYVPVGQERKTINEAFDALVKEIKTRDTEKGGVAMYSPSAATRDQGIFKPVDTSSANFKAWFGGSKVVTRGGRPLVVYHATVANFDAFDTSLSDLGSHFGTEEQANNIADHRLGGHPAGDVKIMPVYLAIKNPLRLKDVGTFHADGIADQLEKKGLLPKGEGRRIIREIDRNWRLRKTYDPMMIDIIKKAGYDGVVYKNTAEHEGAGDSYIVFDATQIKSAISNTGDFSKTDPRINYKEKGPAPARSGIPPLNVVGERNDAQAKKDIAALDKAVNEKRRGRQLDFTAVDVTATVAKRARRIASMFGKRVVFFRGGNPTSDPGGVAVRTAGDVIFVNVASGYSEMNIIGHELLHHLKAQHPDIYDRLKGSILALAKDSAVGDYKERLQRIYDNTGVAKRVDNLLAEEELIADFIGDRFTDQAFWSEMADAEPTLFRRFAEAVKAFIDALLAKFKNMPTFGTDPLVRDLQAARKAAVDALSEYSRREKAGELFKPVTEAELSGPAFKKWFGKSKVKSSDDRPVKVYHGSPNIFYTFEGGRERSNTSSPMAGLGHYFALDAAEAAGYTKGSGNTRSFYLRIEKPYVTTGPQLGAQTMNVASVARLKERLVKQGYDGILIKDEGYLVAFDGRQVKSAEYNTGEFSTENADVRYAPTAGQASSATIPPNLSDLSPAMQALASEIKARMDARKVSARAAQPRKTVPSTRGQEIIAKSMTGAGNLSRAKIIKRFQGYEEMVAKLQNEKVDVQEKLHLLADYVGKFPREVRGTHGLENIPARIASASSDKRRLILVRDALVKIDNAHEAYTKKSLVRDIVALLKKNAPQLKGNIARQTAGGYDLYRELRAIKKTLVMTDKEVGERLNDLERKAATEELQFEDVLELRRLTTYGRLLSASSVEAYQALQSLKTTIAGGKGAWQAEMDALRKRRSETKNEAVRVISGGRELKTETERLKDLQGMAKTYQWFKDSLRSFDDKHQSFEWILDKLSRFDKGSGLLDSPLVKMFSPLVQRATVNEQAGTAAHMALLNEKMQEIFGLEGRALEKRLNKNSAITDKTGVFRRSENGAKQEEIPLSQNMAYKRWMEWQDPTLREQLTKQGYGEATMAEIENFMDDEVMEWAQWQLEEFYPQYYGGVNEVFKKLFYTDMPHNPKYSPIKRTYSKGKEDQNLLMQESHYSSVINGSVRNRVDNNRDIELQDGDTAIAVHLANMEHFKAWAEPMRELRGTLGGERVRQAIKDFHGPAALKTLNGFLDDFARGKSAELVDTPMLQRFRGNFITAVLGVNPVVFLKQLTGIPAFMAEIPAGAWLSNMPKTPGEWVAAWKVMAESEVLKARFGVGFERDLIAAMSSKVPGRMADTRKMAAKLMFFVRYGDKFTVTTGGWPVYQYHYKKALKEGKPEERARAEAMERFEAAAERTQGSGNLKDMSAYQRGGEVARLFTMFMTTPTTFYRQMAGATRELQKSIALSKEASKPDVDPKKAEEMRKQAAAMRMDAARRFVAIGIIMPVAFQFVASAGFDDDDTLREIALGPMNGLFMLRDVGTGIYDYSSGRPIFDSPGTPPPLSTLGEFHTAVSKVLKKWRSDEWLIDEDFWKIVKSTGTVAGNLTGIPVGPVARLGEGVYDAATGDTVNPALRALGYSEFRLDKANREYLDLRRVAVARKETDPVLYRAVTAHDERRTALRKRLKSLQENGADRDTVSAARMRIKESNQAFVEKWGSRV